MLYRDPSSGPEHSSVRSHLSIFLEKEQYLKKPGLYQGTVQNLGIGLRSLSEI